ncbi:MAG TPA: hydrogenase expression/formation protein HypE, partial [Deferrimonas sp.]
MHDKILLSHGEGGKRTRDLIAKVIARYFDNPVLSPFFDAGLLGRIEGEIAFTTDGYVVTPPFFPGGDIGRLAVCGTVNDLAVCGAKAVAISCGLILEEGLPMETLERALAAMRDAAMEAGVTIACGDTKVVERGKGDGIFITTAGIGVSVDGWRPAPSDIRPGDRILLTGTMGDHQVAVLIARQNLAIDAPVLSDVAPLSGLLLPLLPRFADKVRFMRDPTRGGVGVTLNEMAS